jgi:hypothetical protein
MGAAAELTTTTTTTGFFGGVHPTGVEEGRRNN